MASPSLDRLTPHRWVHRLFITVASTDDLLRLAVRILVIPGVERINTVLAVSEFVSYRIQPLVGSALTSSESSRLRDGVRWPRRGTRKRRAIQSRRIAPQALLPWQMVVTVVRRQG